MGKERRFFKQPGKKETLASKQQKRIWRVNHLQGRLSKFSTQWWVGAGEAFGLAVLFFINLFLLYPFFSQEDKTNVFSAPVIPLLASVTEYFIPFSYGVRIWLLIFLLFFPPSFYYFVKEISGRKLAGFLASFLVSLPVGIFLFSRVNLGLFGGDGAHIASLTFAPLACLFLLRFLRLGNFKAGLLSALGTSLVALVSPLGLIVLVTFMMVITFSEMLLGRGRLKGLRFLIVLILVAGFLAFWYNPKFVILTIQSSQGQLVKKTLFRLLPISFFLVPLLGVFGFLLFENRPQLQSLFIAFFLTVIFGLFSLGAGAVHPSPSRFLPAFGISFAFLAGILTVWLFDFLRNSPRLKWVKFISFHRRLVSFGLIGLFFVLVMITFVFLSRNLWELEKSQVLGLTVEQKVGVWEIKEKTSAIENVFGYMITALTFFGAVTLKRKLKT